jgi:excisionase family DNA binding protein
MATDPSVYGEQLAADPIRVGVADAAMRLGVSADTIRRRIKRGQLSASRDNTGKLWLVLTDDPAKASAPLPMQPAAYAPTHMEQSGLVAELREHVASLRSELDHAHAERDRLLTMLEHAQAALAYREEGFWTRLWRSMRVRRPYAADYYGGEEGRD